MCNRIRSFYIPGIFLGLFLICYGEVKAGSRTYYRFNDPCKQAYELTLKLRFVKAKQMIEQLRKTEPNNAVVDYIESSVNFFECSISEEENKYKIYKNKKAGLFERYSIADENSPYHRLLQAESLLQYAAVRLKFNEYLTAAFEIKKGYNLLTENARLFPNFVPTKKMMGLMHILVGSIPDSYKWATQLVGFEGNLNQGYTEVLQFYNATAKDTSIAFYHTEALFIKSFIELNLMNKKVLLEQSATALKPKISDNPLLTFAYANVCMNSDKNDEAIAVLENRKFPDDTFPFHYLDYVTGVAKLNRQDKDANLYFLRYFKNFKGKNYLKSTCQRLSWYYLLEGDTIKYRHFSELSTKVGFKNVDEDKQADKEVNNGVQPNTILLKTRLFFDGGYYSEAMNTLLMNDLSTLRNLRDKLEIVYRLARIYHKQGNYLLAVKNYELSIKNGENTPYYFAANSALQLGLYYEELGDKIKAKEYYTRCLSMKNHEYQNSIDAKAKAGLSRIKK